MVPGNARATNRPRGRCGAARAQPRRPAIGMLRERATMVLRNRANQYAMATADDEFEQGYAVAPRRPVGRGRATLSGGCPSQPSPRPGLAPVGVHRFVAAQPESAIEYFTRAIRLDGGQAAFHNNLGECYRMLGRLDEAQRCYAQAVRLQADYLAPRANLSLTLLAQGLATQAEQVARDGAGNHPRQRRGALRRGCPAAAARGLRRRAGRARVASASSWSGAADIAGQQMGGRAAGGSLDSVVRRARVGRHAAICPLRAAGGCRRRTSHAGGGPAAHSIVK